MNGRILAITSRHGGTILLVTILLVLFVVGVSGEVVAHNPAGQPVPGCENGAGAVGQNNPNCHG
jgi:hypothetical protein